MHLTVFELDDGRFSCLYSHDIRDVDMQGVYQVHKLDVLPETIRKIMDAKVERFEEILKSLTV